MFVMTLIVLAAQALTILAIPMKSRAPEDGFIDPSIGGGSMLDDAAGDSGEPLNVIISGLSSPEVLTNDGVINFARAIGFSTECLGFHLGGAQKANLGDGNGLVDQALELREDFGVATFGLGTCLESLLGGNHFRVFRQNGPQANTGALFLAVSKEEDESKHHTIIPDGYNIGRDELVAAATKGSPKFAGVTYNVVAKNITGLMPAGSNGINHDIAVDGIVTLLTVTIK